MINNKNWKVAVIVFDKSNFKGVEYSKIERSYKISRDNYYFQGDKFAKSLIGDCLDGKDLGVRLDLCNWKVESIEILPN